MALIEIFNLGRTNRYIERTAREVADRCRTSVQARLSAEVATMSPAEARGYVRARAATVVHREIDLATAGDHHASAHRREQLLSRTTAHVVAQVTRDLRKSRSRQTLRRVG